MSKEHLFDMVKATVNGDEKAAADAFHSYVVARMQTQMSEGKKEDEECCDDDAEDKKEDEQEESKKDKMSKKG
jgi:hypothetical protein